MKFLVTGACGYIGSNLCKHLSSKYPDSTIYAFDNIYYNQRSTVETLESISNVVFHEQDVTKFSVDLISAINESDFIIPLAAIVGAPACDKAPGISKNINYNWYETLITICQKGQKIIYPNTNSGYGTTPKGTTCDEKTKTNPLSLYAKTKQDTEDLLMSKYKNNSVCFRLATVFGLSPRPRLDLLVNNFVYRAFVDKNIEIFDNQFRRNFVSVNDVCRAFTQAMTNFESMKGNIYNLGTDELNSTKIEFAKTIQRLTGCELTITTQKTDPDQRDYMISNQKLYATGFRPEDTTLDNEVDNIWKFLEKNINTDLSYTFNY